MAEVKVSSKAETPSGRPGPTGLAAYSPLQAGLLYGGTTAAVLGPAGLLIGLGAGILSKRLRKNFMDREAADVQNLRAEHQGLQSELESEMRIADPEEKRLLSHAQRLASEGWYRLSSGDEAGRGMIEKANELSRSIMTADRDARKSEQSAQASFQRGLIGTAANDYRSQFQTNLQLVEDMDKQASRVLDLVSKPDFDPNKPFNKAILADLLQTGIGGMYKDAPDVLDAVAQGAPSIGAILGAARGPAGAAIGDSLGGLVGAITNGMKAKDFQVSREEYNRIALNLKKFTQTYGTDRMTRLSDQARQLDQFARQTGAIPDDYSLGQYISGGVNELKLTPVPQVPAVKQASDAVSSLKNLPPSEKYVGGINQGLRGLEQWMNKRKQRPTN